ncbi:hypothetical protein [Candidatus Protochlamydia amoebophila]|uniref:Uncharacterized protein n=1 Tax=Candidatus Protochlamydia amoebophila TaxID=362787 RepID=A0A0C1JKZ2_9BACT|nr:hypothetical protein [Candidatus Protochlamydia amoebophila]KIC71955.1 hypothetical protein DB44_CV00020 [Candidatus Protochlamydia amoebophila]
MKMLSKTVLTSILSTLVAANVMAQCSSSGYPWSSHKRCYGSSQQQRDSYHAPMDQNCSKGYPWGSYKRSHGSPQQQGPYNAPNDQGDYYQYYNGNAYYHDFDGHGVNKHPTYGDHPEFNQGYDRPIDRNYQGFNENHGHQNSTGQAIAFEDLQGNYNPDDLNKNNPSYSQTNEVNQNINSSTQKAH